MHERLSDSADCPLSDCLTSPLLAADRSRSTPPVHGFGREGQRRTTAPAASPPEPRRRRPRGPIEHARRPRLVDRLETHPHTSSRCTRRSGSPLSTQSPPPTEARTPPLYSSPPSTDGRSHQGRLGLHCD